MILPIAEPAATKPATERDPLLRLNDWYEVYDSPAPHAASREAARCMSCGAAFCQPSGGYNAGCPIENKIPEWNELVQHGRWREAYERLSLTNPFPEFTSRVCPAPCQDACIHGINGRPVAIKSIERAIIDRAFEEGWVRPQPPARRTGKAVAVIGSGPAGLAAAHRLNRAGHHVAVFERADRPGGLLMYGVPNMKLEKSAVERRIRILSGEGIRFRTGINVSSDADFADVMAHYDAVILACGAQKPRELALPGRDLAGVHEAMLYLTAATRALQRGEAVTPELDAAGKDVIVIGGGDTGADCIATALRQGCRSVLNVTRRHREPGERDACHPWPGPTGVYRLDYAHAEGLARFGRDPREYAIAPLAFVAGAAGAVSGLRVRRLDHPSEAESSEATLAAQLVILAIGFTGTDAGLGITGRDEPFGTEHPRVFLAGDHRLGPSLVVHAIADGLAAAERVEKMLATGVCI